MIKIMSGRGSKSTADASSGFPNSNLTHNLNPPSPEVSGESSGSGDGQDDPAGGSGLGIKIKSKINIKSGGGGGGGASGGDYEIKEVVERILEHNLHGIDLDPRAVQIAAAALWLKSQSACRDARPSQLNLVASNLRLGSLPDNDPALVELRSVVERETGMPGKLTDTIVHALRGADHLGALLQIDKAVDEAIAKHEQELPLRPIDYSRDLFGNVIENKRKIDFDAMATRRSLLDGLESFLRAHTSGEDLGLRTRGEQLAAGVRFMRMIKEGTYDLVVANPPYQGTGKLRDATEYEKHYSIAKTDLFAGMTVRALELLRPSGICAMIALTNWMFIKSFLDFRTHVISHHLAGLADLGKAAFSTGGTLISTACYLIRNVSDAGFHSVAIRPMTPDEVRRDADQPQRAESALLIQRGRYDFDTIALRVVPEWPLVYWWSEEETEKFSNAIRIGEAGRISQGISTTNDTRFIRRSWEVSDITAIRVECNNFCLIHNAAFVPLIKGAAGKSWIEPLVVYLDCLPCGEGFCDVR